MYELIICYLITLFCLSQSNPVLCPLLVVTAWQSALDRDSISGVSRAWATHKSPGEVLPIGPGVEVWGMMGTPDNQESRGPLTSSLSAQPLYFLNRPLNPLMIGMEMILR